MTLDHFLLLPDAASRLRISEVKLRAWIDKGKIRAAILPGGEIGVSEQAVIVMTPTPKDELPEYQKHAHLKGMAIWISEAARKYNVLHQTILKWVNAGYIKRLGNDGYRTFVDEADVAYCAEIYHQRGGQGKWLFKEDGTPYKKGDTGPLGKAT